MHFHDHDDFVNLDFYEKMVNAYHLTNADILCGEVNQPEYNFPTFSSIEICLSMKDKILKTRANKFNPAWRYLYKRSFLTEHNLKFDEKLFGIQDLFFTKTAVVLANSIATVPGAVYNVVDTETALGKSKTKIKQANDNDYKKLARKKLEDLFVKHNALQYMTSQEQPFSTEEYKIFNMCILKKQNFPNKTRYYLFGVNIGTKRVHKQ